MFSLLLLVSLVSVGGSQAAQGDLDPAFGTAGVVETPLGDTAIGAAVGIQPDGRIVVGGTFQFEVGGPFKFGLVRYNPDGSLDSRFGAGGKSAATVSESWENYAAALDFQTDGKIVVAGWSHYQLPNPRPVPVPGPSKNDAALVRFNADGSVDTGFGTDGRVNQPRGSFDPDGHSYELHDVLIQPDGKIVAAGSADGSLLLVRYRSDGSLDDAFGSGGIATLPVAAAANSWPPYASAYSLAREDDGKLVVVGSPAPTWDGKGFVGGVVVARFNADGSLDDTFGSSGSISAAFPAPDAYGTVTAASVIIQPDHKIVVGGGAGPGFLLIRYRADGSPDRSFGHGGLVRRRPVNPVYEDGINALALQRDGRIVAAGTAWISDPLILNGVRIGAEVVRYNPDGSLDKVFAAPSSFGGATALAIQPDGKVIAASQVNANHYNAFALARFLAASTPCVVPNVRGRRLAGARGKITHAHCSLGRVRRIYSAKVTTGRVLSQQPRPHARLPVQAKVALLVSRGKR